MVTFDEENDSAWYDSQEAKWLGYRLPLREDAQEYEIPKDGIELLIEQLEWEDEFLEVMLADHEAKKVASGGALVSKPTHSKFTLSDEEMEAEVQTIETEERWGNVTPEVVHAGKLGSGVNQ